MPTEHQENGRPVQRNNDKQVSGCTLVNGLTTCSVGSEFPARPSEREIAAAAAARGRLDGKVFRNVHCPVATVHPADILSSHAQLVGQSWVVRW